MNVRSRVIRMEERMGKMERNRFNMKDIFKKMNPEDIKMMEKTVDTYLRHFKGRFIDDDFIDIPSDISLEEKNKCLTHNYVQIRIRFILSMQRESLGSKDDAGFMKEVRQLKELGPAIKSSERSFKREEEMYYS